ncbi:aminotransferase [Sulfitobacter pseudonitzschiae]|uniref:aspartate transaminase n=1 Tax=Pseudosulfitobacter pseudonitzschiae TaxID=1402135 RepID=A0A9Q2NG12_9RHOB|nr:aminotransferase [Pseudosulfitobacter pseudonitzschiae]MBM2291191.1 aminotransferase [Pseudosulfitobacter pseudonitzschiae]MBM2296109.1 aminotransferase [Pseudosulfitobacter pseudonitzschiae]MBM2301022.1 aminotransferase [Pseudosulfitobacter pseudonitzschiae]MBM2310806.1 aminotransferase [Pseudosulfitobacter pseudonitzschiae]MBM2315719.1 aminotransferase [Pseudosulfitobacter pseudonitzschiae]
MNLPRTATTFAPPVMEARRWLDGVTHPADRPLINVSQAAPVDPPPPALRQAMADAALTKDDAHLYGPVLGMPALRDALAAQISTHYEATVTGDHVAITSGCNQAFAAAIATLCAEGDEVILPTPWYFNHKMWLDMSGVTSVALRTGDDLLPDVDAARALITPRTRAIALVTPNNPGGVEYPAELVRAFYDLARDAGITLMVDETYRDFDSRTGAPHALFQQDGWQDTFIHLYSFSKAYRLTGHRVGALAASPARLAEVEKFLDTVAICPGQIGQYAALWGLENLSQWVAGERDEILARRAAIASGFDVLAAKGWRLLGLGAYFAYMEHPFAASSADLAPQLVREAGILCLPGTMFCPTGDISGQRQLRIAFANLDVAGIAEFYHRLSGLDLPR